MDFMYYGYRSMYINPVLNLNQSADEASIVRWLFDIMISNDNKNMLQYIFKHHRTVFFLTTNTHSDDCLYNYHDYMT